MTTAPFASAMHMLNASVPAVLANATATYQGGAPFGVLFDRTPADPFGNGAVDSAACTASFVAVNAPGLAEGSTLVIDGVNYTVASGVQPDAGGWVTVTVYPRA